MSTAPTKQERTDYRTLVQKEYLGQWDLMRPDGSFRRAVVVIERVERYVPRNLRAGERVKRLKITFRGQRKAWLAGPVSQSVLALLFGPIVQDWIGKRIELYVDPHVRMGRKITGGVRVTERSPDARTPTTEEQLDVEPPPEMVAAIDDAFGDEP